MGDEEDPASVDRSSTLRIATWNVWANLGPWQERYPLIRAELARLQPDIICLQEVWESPDFDAAEELARGLGFEFRSEVAWFEPMNIKSGLAVLSRWPIASSARVSPPVAHPSEGALFQPCLVEGPRGNVQVYNVMLAWRPDHSEIRCNQLRELGQLVKAQGNRREAMVVCGDFNAAPDADEIRAMTGLTSPIAPGVVFTDCWAQATAGDAGHTWTSRNAFTVGAGLPDRRIDYVFSAWGRPDGMGFPCRAGLLGNDDAAAIFPSDHFGVWADVNY